MRIWGVGCDPATRGTAEALGSTCQLILDSKPRFFFFSVSQKLLICTPFPNLASAELSAIIYFPNFPNS